MELFLKFKYQLNIIFLVKQFRISIGLYFDRLNILRGFFGGGGNNAKLTFLKINYHSIIFVIFLYNF